MNDGLQKFLSRSDLNPHWNSRTESYSAQRMSFLPSLKLARAFSMRAACSCLVAPSGPGPMIFNTASSERVPLPELPQAQRFFRRNSTEFFNNFTSSIRPPEAEVPESDNCAPIVRA